VRPSLAILLLLAAAVVGYFLLWPVPVDPVAWQAPVDRGYVDPFARNDSLASAVGLDLGDLAGPEDATLGLDGNIYVTTEGGTIVRLQDQVFSVFADVGGRPLGIETDRDGSLLVANAYRGLQRVTVDGQVSLILDTVDGRPLLDANNIGIAPDGTIYFSQSSDKFSSVNYQGSYGASLLDLLEHGGHGRILAFNASTGELKTVLDGLNYANGVAVSEDGSYLVIAETGHYRILKHWLAGPDHGTTEVLLENLPAFPDNVKSGQNGRFWIGMVAPRNDILDHLSDKPLLRKMVQRLPPLLRPKAVPVAHVIAINGEGDVIFNLHDQSLRFITLTGAVETDTHLYLTSLFGKQLPVIAKRDW
jgi:sugar lactone lactonase YvrE